MVTQERAEPAAPHAAPIDAYRALQVLPSAPHDLIEQAYWVLVGHTRREGNHSGRLGRLNDAYATLINPERRDAYDTEHGLTKLRGRPRLETPKRPMFSRGPKYTTRLSHYQLLDVAYDALPEIVDTAYVYRKATIKASDPTAIFERTLVEEAYETLGNPQRRAQYDLKIGAVRMPATAPAPAVVTPPEPAAPERYIDAPVPEHMSQPQVPTPPVVAEAPAPVAPAPVAPVSVEPVPAPYPEMVEPEAERGPGPVRRFASMLRRTASGVEGKASQKMQETRHQRALRTEARSHLVEAEHRRLQELGLLGDAPPPPAPDLIPDAVGGVRAQFRFVDGPQAGEVIHLAENSLILGASDAADVVLANPDGMIGAGHVRVWRRDHEYILHQLDSFSTTYVNGDRLDLRLAILEPHDEIRIGQHTLVFDSERVATPEPPQEDEAAAD